MTVNSPAAPANTGGGGGGGSCNNGALGIVGGWGGGSGGTVRHIYGIPAATYAYAIGAGGAVGVPNANGYFGGAGGSGVIIIIEHYGG